MSGKRIGKYEIGRTLGTGASCKVKLGLDTETGRKVAVKLMNKDMDEAMMKLIDTEVNALRAIAGHSNVINILDMGNALYEKGKGRDETRDFMILEIAQGGELFDFIALSGRFSEPLARHFF
jgi:serine/threonine protein kinase